MCILNLRVYLSMFKVISCMLKNVAAEHAIRSMPLSLVSIIQARKITN